MIEQIIEQWKNDTDNIYKNKDLIKFIKPLLEYVLDKNDEKQQIIYDFISFRKNFTNDRPSTIIINYMKKIFNEKNEIILKKKFKLVKELGSDRRENLVENLKHHVKKINEIKNRDKQIVTQKITVKELEETVRKQKTEIAKLTLENININKRYEELSKDKKELEYKCNASIEENYENIKKLLTEKEKSSEKDLCINDLSSQNKILKMQLNHSHNK